MRISPKESKDYGINMVVKVRIYTLPETNSQFAPENQWLEAKLRFVAEPIFRGKITVSFRGVYCIVLQQNPLPKKLPSGKRSHSKGISPSSIETSFIGSIQVHFPASYVS